MTFVATDPSSHNSENTWFTPIEFKKLGVFDLDPCTVSYRPHDMAVENFKRPCHEHWFVGGNFTYGRLDISKIDAMSDDWELQQEPRKVTLYQYLYETQDGSKMLSRETSGQWDCTYEYCGNYKLLKTFTREIEF